MRKVGLLDFIEQGQHLHVVMNQKALQRVSGLPRFKFQQDAFALFLAVEGIRSPGGNEHDVVPIGNIAFSILHKFAVAGNFITQGTLGPVLHHIMAEQAVYPVNGHNPLNQNIGKAHGTSLKTGVLGQNLHSHYKQNHGFDKADEKISIKNDKCIMKTIYIDVSFA